MVAGSSRGIGAAVRDALLARGHRVVGVARRAEEFAGDRYSPVALDLSRHEQAAARLRAVLAREERISALVCALGSPLFGHLEQVSERQIRDHLDLNLLSPILLVRTVLAHLKRQPRSDVVLIGSEASLRGGRRGSIYCAAKFGLRGFAQALREEASGSGVHVSLVLPGMVRTGFFEALDFEPGAAPDNAVEPGDIAAGVALILESRDGTVFEELTVMPLKKVVRRKPPESDATRGPG
jgi:NAD(P)-dependent dehydrogenase (short-subunit alcohol dehydrogenase family)